MHITIIGKEVPIESKYLGVLFQQHLLQDWPHPFVKFDIVIVGHQSVSIPAAKETQNYSLLKLMGFF